MIWLFRGKQISTIRDYLNNNNIPTANQIRYNKATFWENKTIKNILQNEIYTGVTIQNKRSRISYKNRKLKSNPKDEWNIVENTHEPIIDKKVFKAVQKMIIVQKHSRNEKKYTYLLDGLLICYECKHKIGVRARKNGRLDMICNNYRRNSKLGICTSHGFNYEKLEEQVLKYIKNLFLIVDKNKIEMAILNSKKKYDYGKILKRLERELKLINDNIDKMYIDKLNNKISEEMYERLFKKLKNEAKKKEEECIKLKRENLRRDNSKEIRNRVKEFLELKELTPEMAKVIINRMEIHQDKQVDIIFNFKSYTKEAL